MSDGIAVLFASLLSVAFAIIGAAWLFFLPTIGALWLFGWLQ